MKTIAFDVYGTLIDPQDIIREVEKLESQKAESLVDIWRSKQLEYTFRRGLMKLYVDFSQCTREALDFACMQTRTNLTDTQKKQLVEAYQFLPAFPDVEKSLLDLKQAGHRLFAFSNGTKIGVETVLKNAGIINYFEGVVSADSILTFKPDPAVYKHLTGKTKSERGQTWLVSGNSFDVIGAVNFGLKAAWVKRNPSVILDPWGVEPTVIISMLGELINCLDD
ncbi:MAG: haloacid dehalogenase type II [Flavobacteriaceae bacterium]|nr:haloacid dehalogenase type II [Flavobacteriaceae bacterium]MDZ4149421.1 haloacid dehalogenase type II [Flavobacteriaceae bacterium]